MKSVLGSSVAASAGLLLLVALGGCSSDGGSSGSSNAGSTDGGDKGDSALPVEGRVPVQHRPSDAACALPAAEGTCSSASTAHGSCTSDSQCTNGTNGRCLTASAGVASTDDPACLCAYDACSHDTDCGSGQTCACHGAPYTDGQPSACIQGNCRVDADCGTAGYCSPSSLPTQCGDGLAGYYCHTAKDECVDDSDCAPDGGDTFENRCEYSTTTKAWSCVQVEVCS